MASVKNKIRWGTVFLFLLVMAAGGVGIYYLVTLRLSNRNIIRANYESLEYVQQMDGSLDSIQNGKVAYVDSFANVLRQQASNITEPGEGAVTRSLQWLAPQLMGDSGKQQQARALLRHIAQLNMQAIQRKSAAAEKEAEGAVTIIIAVVAIILLIGLTFVVNFPGILTDPISKLTQAIKEISRRNYHHRIHIQSKDEFGELANAFNEMAERLEYFESSNLAQILFEKSRAEAVINSLKDASIGIDKAGTVLFANHQALGLLGLMAKDIVGRSAAEVTERNDLFRFLLEEKGSSPFKVVVEGKENYFVKETIELGETAGQGRVLVLKNITSFKELDAAKTQFIATVSHELKTPLAASDFSLKLLEDNRVGQLSAEQKELVQNLKADNQRMLRILSELLNLSQVEAGRLQLDLQPVAPIDVVSPALAAVATAAKEQDIQILTDLQEPVPAAKADRDKATWVLVNLLTNAVRYSPSGTTVQVQVAALEGVVRFSVHDQGMGIKEEHLPRVFDRYYQVPGQSDKKGSGIGLAICKEMMEAMGGRIGAESVYGRGSSFWFELPVAER